MSIKRYSLNHTEECMYSPDEGDGEFVLFDDVHNLLNEVRGYLVAAADGSMSRNNSEQLASELLANLDDLLRQ